MIKKIEIKQFGVVFVEEDTMATTAAFAESSETSKNYLVEEVN